MIFNERAVRVQDKQAAQLLSVTYQLSVHVLQQSTYRSHTVRASVIDQSIFADPLTARSIIS